MSLYLLPHHPSLTSIDPLGICDDEQDEVSHFKILKTLMTQTSKELEMLEGLLEDVPDVANGWALRFGSLLEDIAYSLHGDSSLDTNGLCELLSTGTFTLDQRRNFRRRLFSAAMGIEELFPAASLAQLSNQMPIASFSCAQTDTLLAHLFLGTVQIPKGNEWGRPGFTQLFADNEPVKNTSRSYLETLIWHFVTGGYEASAGLGNCSEFHLSSGKCIPNLNISDQIGPPIPVVFVDQPSEPSGRQDAFVLVAANSQPGPGPAGTQEERLVGQSPALAIASLLTPVLASDEAVVTSAFPVHASWQGHGRHASVLEIYPPYRRPRRRYIIADALPLDLGQDGAEDSSANVAREVRKLYAAFSGAKNAWCEASLALDGMRIEVPPWGCGAFGGTLAMKVPCMMMAAGLAGLKSDNLELMVTRDRMHELASVPMRSFTLRHTSCE